MADEYRRPDPDALLASIKAQEEPNRGTLRIWLGAAPGVGKTFAALEEARRRKARGTDVVIGFVETHGRQGTAEQIDDLEIVPPIVIRQGDVQVREMDTAAVIVRKPKVAVVDDLAHTNTPASSNSKRYEDVRELLDAGITVISTLDVQQIESLQHTVEQVTGVVVDETVPDRVVEAADQIELIDILPEDLIQRVERGLIYPPDQSRIALERFFTVSNLASLRDLALRTTARAVEGKLDAYLRERRIEAAGAIGERIMVAVDHRQVGKTLIRRGWRTAAALKGDLIVVHVEPDSPDRRPQTPDDERRLGEHLQLADELGAGVVQLRGKVADELVGFARAHRVSQLVIGHPTHGRWHDLLRGSVTDEILRRAPGLDVHIIGTERKPPN
jgi:two-component system sensor histidine kinase KdpD